MTFYHDDPMYNTFRGRHFIAHRSADNLLEVIKRIGSEDGSDYPAKDVYSPECSEALKHAASEMVRALLKTITLMNHGQLLKETEDNV